MDPKLPPLLTVRKSVRGPAGVSMRTSSTRTDRGAVGLGPDEAEMKPAVRRSGILEQCIAGRVPGEGAAHADVDVLIAVIVEVGEGDPVTLLDVAGASGGGDFLEAFPGVVSEHPVGNQRREVGVSRGEVEVEPTVVVEVSEVAAHRVADALHSGLLRHVLERAVAVVAIELRHRSLAGKPG